jgi:Zn-dependent alcohol dehydrogenase
MITDALVVASAGAPFKFQRVELDETLRPMECLVRIKATGVSISNRDHITALAK